MSDKLVVVFEAGNAFQVHIIKNQLEQENVFCCVQGETVQDLFGWGRE